MTARALAVLAITVALGLQVWAIHAHSLSGDGAYHFLAGHQALRYGQNTVNLEHPPLVKLLVALPLVLRDQPLAPPVRVDRALATIDRMHSKSALLRSATIESRYLVLICFALPLLLAGYALGRRHGGVATGVTLALMLALSFDVLPQLTILQTDVPVTLAFVLTLLAGRAFVGAPSYRNALLLALAWGFGLAVKYSAALLAPAIVASLLLAPDLRTQWRRRLVQAALIGAVSWLVVDGSYLLANLDYRHDVGREVIRDYCENRGTLEVAGRMRGLAEPLLAVERVDPFITQWLTGFLGVRAQNAVAPYASFAFGEVRSRGRWWYFPAVLLVKTPIAILLAALVWLTRTRWKRPRWRREWILPAIVAATYLAAAVTSNYNLGVRHLLPVLPLLYLPVARFAARSRPGAALLIGVLAIESLAVAPLWMSQTNTWWLGSHNPTRFALAAGNLEFRQNFVQLARAVERRGIEDLNVLYPALGERVVQAYLPDAHLARPGDPVEPGWYAVNVIVEQFVPALLRDPPPEVYDVDNLRRAAESWWPFWQAVVSKGEDMGWVAGTFHLYRVDP